MMQYTPAEKLLRSIRANIRAGKHKEPGSREADLIAGIKLVKKLYGEYHACAQVGPDPEERIEDGTNADVLQILIDTIHELLGLEVRDES